MITITCDRCNREKVTIPPSIADLVALPKIKIVSVDGPHGKVDLCSTCLASFEKLFSDWMLEIGI